MERRTRILIVDDDAQVRRSLRSLVEGLGDVEVVAEAADGEAAIHAARLHRPDIALMDLTMPRLSGLEATARMRHDAPDVRVIVVSIHNADGYVQYALGAGARGYVPKDAVSSELEPAIRAVARGDVYVARREAGDGRS